MRIEPPPSRWAFPPADEADSNGVVGVGADLEPGTLLAAYRAGLFPMPSHLGGPVAWWSPDPRGILPLDHLRVTRSLRQSCRRYVTTVDEAFERVIQACADPSRDGRWITGEIIDAYTRLHEMGWAHSIEAWTIDGQLAGGLYGVAIGGFFAGESMFHVYRDASKVALVRLVEILREGGAMLLDVQWTTDHLASLGAVDIPRRKYLRVLRHAVELPADPFADIPGVSRVTG
ncbi:MAG: leucyl/phenylalanyl-tRNA--protein transferase [Acidimicrobiales bacterium]|nr:leucyl/phenylalanyl-tRNA--protein transferase [Acidimicrobiales bacterium]